MAISLACHPGFEAAKYDHSASVIMQGDLSAGKRVRDVLRTMFTARSRGSLQGLEKLDEVVDLIGFELELRHAGMPGHDPFGEGFFQFLDRIALVQATKWRRNPERAWAHLIDGMALGAVKQRQASALLDAGGLRALRRC